MKRVDKPWGHELIWAHTDKYVGKILFVKKGESLSQQYHNIKDETIFIQSGEIDFEVNGLILNLREGDSYRITPKTVHRMVAVEDTTILEASTPELDDVVRLQDRYGRS